MSKTFSFAALLALSSMGTAATAIAGNDGLFSINGFGTLGVVHSNNDQADFVRDISQNEGAGFTRKTDFGVDSLLGVQINTRPSEQLDGALQVVSRRSTHDFRPEITWAYLRYTLDDNLQLRVGRVGFDAYMLADSRNVGYSYQWVRPPVDFFGSLIISYFDGADLVWTHPIQNGLFRAKLYAGLAREEIRIGTPAQYLSFDRSRLTGGHIEFQTTHWLYRIGYAQARLHNENPLLAPLLAALNAPQLNMLIPSAAVLADELALKDKLARYYSAGLVFDDGPLQAQLMLNQVDTGSSDYPHTRAGYFTLAYRFNKWTPYFTYSASRSILSAPNTVLPTGINPAIDALAYGAQAATREQLNHRNTLSLGIRYALSEKADLKLQADLIESKQHLLVRNLQPGWNGKANLLSAAINFIF